LSTANLDGDEVLLLGAPVAKRRSVLAGEKGTSRSTSPAAAPLCHGREHVLGRDETAVHESANADRRSAAHRHEQGLEPIPLFPKSPFCPLAKNNQNLNRSQIFTKKKLVQNFVSYKTCFDDQS
jgi:hypothetical protein